MKILQLALLLALATGVEALQENFAITAPSTITVIACTQQSSELIITNTGQITSAYTITQQGQQLAVISENRFVLPSGQTKTVKQTINTPCNAQPTTLTTTITTSLGNTKTIQQKIQPLIQKNIAITAQIQKAKTNPCEQANYNIQLTNTGNFQEKYTTTTEAKIPIKGSTAQTSLAPGQTQTIPIQIIPAICTQTGNHIITAITKASTSQQQEKTFLQLEINNPGIPSIKMPKIRIDYTNNSIPITITNTGKPTTYDIKIQNIPWAAITPNTIFIASEETKTAIITTKPPKNTKKATHKGILTITSEGKTYTAGISIQLKPETFIEKNKTTLLGTILGAIILALVAMLVYDYTQSPEYKQRQQQHKEEILKKLKQKLEIKRKEEEKRKQEQEKTREEHEQKAIERQKKAKVIKEKTKNAAKRIRNIFLPIILILILGGLGYAGYTYRETIKQNYQYAIGGTIAVLAIILAITLKKIIPRIKTQYAEIKRKREERRKQRQKEQEQQERARQELLENKKKEKEEEKRKQEELTSERIAHRQKALLTRWEERKSAELKQNIDKEYKRMHYIVGKRDVVQHVRSGSTGVIATLGILFILSGFIIRYKNYVIAYPLQTMYGLLLIALLYVITQIVRTHTIKIRIPVIVKDYGFTTPWEISHVSFTAQNPVKNLTLKIRRNKRNLTFLPVQGDTFRYFKISSNVRDEHVGKAVITFKVPKKWALHHQEIKIAKLTNKWSELEIHKTSEDKKNTYYQAKTDKLTGTYTIFAKPILLTEKKRTWIPITITLLMLLIIALAYPLTNKNAEGIPEQQWEQNTIHLMNLSKYFADPDNDLLTYDANNTEHVAIEIFRETATLIPEQEWTGREFTVFTATDNKGGFAKSNTVILTVYPTILKPEYRKTIQAVSIILILLLLGIYLFLNKNRKHTNNK